MKEVAGLVTPDTAVALVHTADREEVRRKQAPWSGTAPRGRNDTGARRQDGDRKLKLGLYKDLRRSS